MQVTIELNAAQVAQLTAAAQAEGLAPPELASRLVTQHLWPGDPAPVHFYFSATPDEFRQALDGIADMNRGLDLPVLSDEAFDREGLYEDRL